MSYPASSSVTEQKTISNWLILLLAFSCGLTAANLYYAQPLAGPISAALGLSPKTTGFIVTLTQMGYALGLLFIAPLGDLVENRKLTLILLAIAALSLASAGLSTHPVTFLLSSLFIGISAVAVQVLVPYAAHLAPEKQRGRVVGKVMSGLMLGIMLARPVSSFITQLSSWHRVFFISAAAMLLLAVVLARILPKRMPAGQVKYGAMLLSMVQLVRTTAVLRRRSLYHACLFAAFSLFWTTTPLLLAGPEFRLSQGQIALFALAGISGVIGAPIAGRLADKGWTRPATGLAMLAVALSFLITHIAAPGSHWAMGLLVIAAILLDFGVVANQVLSQNSIFRLGAEYRARLNGIYMTTFFIGGAIGSALGGWAYAHGGWWLASMIGGALPLLALGYFATERGTHQS